MGTRQKLGAAAVALVGLTFVLMVGQRAHASAPRYAVAPGGSGICSSGQPTGTFGNIAAALSCAQEANPPATSPATISIAPGTYTEPLLAVEANVNIVGTPNQTIVEGGRVVVGAYTVNITGLTIQHGRAPAHGSGGGIFSFGRLTLSNSTVDSNSASEGGGIANRGMMTIANSTVRGNSTEGFFTHGGGGIINNGSLTILNSVITGNTTLGSASVDDSLGGGILNEGTLMLANSAITGNTASAGGGGIFNSGTVTMLHSTVTGNVAFGIANYPGDPTGGGGVYDNGGTVILQNSQVVSNSPENCAPPAVVAGCTT